MGLSKDFVETRLLPFRSEYSAYVLDVRMCQLRSLEYDFQWGHWIVDERESSSRERSSFLDGGKTEQPVKVVKVDASLNELTELNIESLKPFVNLKSLDFSLNRIRRVCKLGQFRSLVNIDLSHNMLDDISFLSFASTVVELNLSMNEITNIEALPSLVSLNTLHLNDNQLRSLEGIQSLPYLKELQIQRNNIQSLLPLTANRQLICLNAAHNKLDSLKNTVNTIQYLNELKSVILLGNPIEGDPEYQTVLMRLDSLTSVDNVTVRKDLSHLAFKSETENMGNLKDAARQAFWNQLTLRRNHMDENVRFLQQRILQQQEEFRDYETKLTTELETTLMHLNSLTLGARHSPPQAIQHPPQRANPELNLPSHAPEPQPVNKPSKPRRGIYKGITDTDEILRLASTQLLEDQ